MSTSIITAPYAEPLWLSRQSSPYYNDSHRKLQKVARQYVDTHIAPYCEQWERQGAVPKEAIARHAAEGYMAVSVYPLAKDCLRGQKLPADIPPDEWDSLHDLIIIDEIARCGYLGVIWGLACGNNIGAPPMCYYGTKEQKDRFLVDVLNGKSRFCLGVTEPDAGSDVAGITTTAVRQGDHYIVNGAKKWITNGSFADYCTAAVRTGGDGYKGVSALIIPMKTKGVTCRKLENSGVAASGSTYIEFDDVKVPISNLLGEENKGFEIIMSNFNHERLWLAATSLRLARVCLLDAHTHSLTRHTFGQPLISNQTIRSKLSLMGRLLDSAHSYMESIVYLMEQERITGRNMHLAGSIANLKVLAGNVLEKVNREAQQVFGGLGYSRGGRGGRVEQISRDVRVMVVGGGSEEILSDLAVKGETKALRELSRL